MKNVLIILFLLQVLTILKAQVFITPSGSHYHLATCRMVKNVSKETSVSNALKTGYKSCRICRPPIINGIFNAPHKAKGEGLSYQCKGRTKRGTRCRHRTRIRNGFCFQHQ